MDYPSVEQAARETVELLKIYPFRPLYSMRGQFAKVNINWREYDMPDNKAHLLTICMDRLKAAGVDKREVCDFFANYLHSVVSGYRELYLDIVFGECQLH